VVRHGESTGNVLGLVQGQDDTATLTARGRHQSVKLSERFGPGEVGAIYGRDRSFGGQKVVGVTGVGGLAVEVGCRGLHAHRARTADGYVIGRITGCGRGLGRRPHHEEDETDDESSGRHRPSIPTPRQCHIPPGSEPAFSFDDVRSVKGILIWVAFIE